VEGDLEINIINNYDAEALETKKGAGIGLNNVKDRLQLLYNRSDLLTYGRENGYFEVSIRLPQKGLMHIQ
jgi:sensor histidine kinase YesM